MPKYITEQKNGKWQVNIVQKVGMVNKNNCLGTYADLSKAEAVRNEELIRLRNPEYYRKVYKAYPQQCLDQIKQLLTKGLTRKQIAKETGIIFDSVTYYCDMYSKQINEKEFKPLLHCLLFNKWDSSLKLPDLKYAYDSNT